MNPSKLIAKRDHHEIEVRQSCSVQHVPPLEVPSRISSG
jgi:hypothetical protein